MPLTFTAASSSRIAKSKPKKPSFKRATSSPFAGLNQRKSIQRTLSKPEGSKQDDEDLFEDRLDDLGLVALLANDLSLRDVVQTMNYIRTHMFENIPERSGMNSTRIAEVLNFRRNLPPIVTNSHVHALIKSPTLVEKEIAELTAAGFLRRIVVPGRGVGQSSLSDALVLVNDWEQSVRAASILDEALKDIYIHHLRKDTSTAFLSPGVFSTDDVASVMRAGFLSSASASLNSANIFARPIGASSGTMISVASVAKAASGSMDAIGGHGAVHGAGGGGSGGLMAGRIGSTASTNMRGYESLIRDGSLQLALPSTGSFLKLLTDARSHLMTLLSKSKYNEAPLYLLRERWDGGIGSGEPGANPSRLAHGFAEVLPGRTRKWKQFYGLKFEWVLEECVGAGLAEVFETGSVGRGVRAT